MIYEETVIDERFEFPVQAGGVVRGIGFRVLDEQSRVLNLEPYRPNSHLTIALYPEGKADHAKRRAISLPDADFINAVKVRRLLQQINFLSLILLTFFYFTGP